MGSTTLNGTSTFKADDDVREDVEREWAARLAAETRRTAEKEAWADELVKQLDRERRVRTKLEEERQALAAFVRKFDALGGALGTGSAAGADRDVEVADPPTDSISSVAFCPVAEYLAVGSWDNQVE